MPHAPIVRWSPLLVVLFLGCSSHGSSRESAPTRARHVVPEQHAENTTAAQAEMANVMIAKFTNDGYIVKDGDMLKSQVSFDKGQMLVNGKPIGRAPAQ